MVGGFEGTEKIIDSCFYLQLLDADGNVQVICAYGVKDIVTVARSRSPRNAGELFPVIRAFIPRMSMVEASILLIRLDNTQWLPRHVEDSWELMKSAFGQGYMIMGGWGTSLFPQDPS